MTDLGSVIADISRAIRLDATGQPQQSGVSTNLPYRLEQILETKLDPSPAPAMLTVGTAAYPKKMRFLGNHWDYAPGDTVAWVNHNGAPLILGKVGIVGSPLLGSPDRAPWHVIGDSGEPAFENSWVYYGAPYTTPAFWKQSDGWVHLRGLIKNGSAANATMFHLPEGYRPPKQMFFSVHTDPNNIALLKIETDGLVSCFASGATPFITLDNVMFPTEWNRSQWSIGVSHGGTAQQTSYILSDPLFFTRDDGLVYIQGVIIPAAGGIVMAVPERARKGKASAMLPVYGSPTIARFAVGGPYPGVITFDAGTAGNDHFLGGSTYWGEHSWSYEDWTDLPFATGWDHFDTGGDTAAWDRAQYRMDNHGVVHVRGLVRRSGGTGLVGTLPTGYRPNLTHLYTTMSDNAQSRVDITQNGNVVYISGLPAVPGYGNLNGLKFRAEQ